LRPWIDATSELCFAKPRHIHAQGGQQRHQDVEKKYEVNDLACLTKMSPLQRKNSVDAVAGCAGVCRRANWLAGEVASKPAKIHRTVKVKASRTVWTSKTQTRSITSIL
jgi:hypothetical protein